MGDNSFRRLVKICIYELILFVCSIVHIKTLIRPLTLYLHFASFKPNHTKSLNESKLMAILEIMLIS